MSYRRRRAYGRDKANNFALATKARRAVNNLKFIWAESRSRLFCWKKMKAPPEHQEAREITIQGSCRQLLKHPSDQGLRLKGLGEFERHVGLGRSTASL